MGPVAPRPEVRYGPRSDRVRLLGARVRPTTLFAAVRARTAALQATEAFDASLERAGSGGDIERLTGIQEMRRERTRRRISKESWQRSERSHRGLEGLSSGGGPIIRV